MKVQNPSSIFRENEKMSKEELDKIVTAILNEKVNTQPHDFISRVIAHDYGESNHKVLGIEGIFSHTETRILKTSTGIVKNPDELMIILPDNENIPVEIAAIIGYQTYRVNDDKVKSLFETTEAVAHNLKKISKIYIVTNYNEGTDERIYKYKSMDVVVHFINFDEEKIYEILNTLKMKDYTIKEMSEEEFVNFIQAIAFVKAPYAQDFVEKSILFFATIEKMDEKHRLDTFHALKTMIKAYFKDDEMKKRGLMEMAVKSIPQPSIDKINTHSAIYKEIEAYKTFNEEIMIEKEELRIENDEMRIKIENQEEQLSEKDILISNLLEENKKLKSKTKK